MAMMSHATIAIAMLANIRPTPGSRRLCEHGVSKPITQVADKNRRTHRNLHISNMIWLITRRIIISLHRVGYPTLGDHVSGGHMLDVHPRNDDLSTVALWTSANNLLCRFGLVDFANEHEQRQTIEHTRDVYQSI